MSEDKELIKAYSGAVKDWLVLVQDYNMRPRRFQNIWVEESDTHISMRSGTRYTKNVPGTNTFTATWEENEVWTKDSLGARVIQALAIELERKEKALSELQTSINALCSDYHGE